ncbi:MAG: tetratricopeptide repeat-containing protein kinase family protein, partial [Pseudomonadota bacterium]
AADGPLAADAIHRLAVDLAGGLAAVHEAGISHGDLKPANVWLDDRGRALLMDFGAATPVDDDRPARFGSPVTMAPELFDGGAAGPAADVWALGAVLSFAATGAYPIAGDSFETIRETHRRGADAGRVISAAPLAADMRRLITTMLAAAPAERPTPEAALRELTEIQTAPQRRLRRRALAAAVASLVIGLVASLLFLRQAHESEAQSKLLLERSEAVSELLFEVIDRPRFAGPGATIAEGIRGLAGQIDDALVDDPVGRAELLTHLGHTTMDIEDLELAGRWLDEAIVLFEAEGIRDERARYATRMKANLLARAGRFEEGVDLITGDTGAITLGGAETASDLLDAFTFINIRSQTGRDNGPLVELAETANQLADGIAWTKPSFRLHGYESLARIQVTTGQYREAEATLDAGVMWAAAAGIEDPDGQLQVLREYQVQVYIETGRLREAEATLTRNLEILRDWLGPDHFDTIRAENLQGILLYNMGRFEDAAALLEVLYARIGDLPSIDDGIRVDVGSNLANALKEIGRKDEAMAMYEASRDLARERSGSNDIRVLMLSSNIAELHVDLGQWAEAHAVAEETLALDEAALGPAHPFTNHARTMLGSALTGLGRLDEAEAALETARGHFEATVGAGTPLHLQASIALARNLLAQGRTAAARELASKLLPVALESLGAEHPYSRSLAELAAG